MSLLCGYQERRVGLTVIVCHVHFLMHNANIALLECGVDIGDKCTYLDVAYLLILA